MNLKDWNFIIKNIKDKNLLKEIKLTELLSLCNINDKTVDKKKIIDFINSKKI